MEPLSQRSVGKLPSFDAPIPTRRTLVPPKGVDPKAAMFFVRSTTYCGHRITVENGRPGAIQRAQYRYFIKEGVLDITLEEHREYQAQGEKKRSYYARLQRELEHFEGPFEYRYDWEQLDTHG